MARTGPIARRAAGALVVLLASQLPGCGGGDGDGGCSITSDSGDLATSVQQAFVGGRTSLPAGSERSGGTVFVPFVTCQLGAHELTWSNASNGTGGSGILLWDCGQDFARWSASIPLAVGLNNVTVTLKDSVCQARVTITITRS